MWQGLPLVDMQVKKNCFFCSEMFFKQWPFANHFRDCFKKNSSLDFCNSEEYKSSKIIPQYLIQTYLRQILLTKIFHGSKFKKLLRKCFVCISLSAVVAFFVYYCQIWQKVIEKSPFPRYNKKSQRNLSKKILSWSFSLFKFSQQFGGVS